MKVRHCVDRAKVRDAKAAVAGGVHHQPVARGVHGHREHAATRERPPQLEVAKLAALGSVHAQRQPHEFLALGSQQLLVDRREARHEGAVDQEVVMDLLAAEERQRERASEARELLPEALAAVQRLHLHDEPAGMSPGGELLGEVEHAERGGGVAVERALLGQEHRGVGPGAPTARGLATEVAIAEEQLQATGGGENDSPVEGFSDEALRALMAYPWPGNVRELENAIERAVVLCEGNTIGADLLPSSTTTAPSAAGTLDLLIPGITMAEVERIVIERTLDAVGGSTAKAAEILGISRRKIQYRLKEWSQR